MTDLSFERTRDYELVRSIVTHPHVWGSRAGTWHAPEHPGIWYVIARRESEPCGVFVFLPSPHTPEDWDVHMALLPRAWGKSSRALSLAAARWFHEQTGARRLLAHVPEPNRAMHALARRIGMSQLASDTYSFLLS